MWMPVGVACSTIQVYRGGHVHWSELEQSHNLKETETGLALPACFRLSMLSSLLPTYYRQFVIAGSFKLGPLRPRPYVEVGETNFRKRVKGSPGRVQSYAHPHYLLYYSTDNQDNSIPLVVVCLFSNNFSREWKWFDLCVRLWRTWKNI